MDLYLTGLKYMALAYDTRFIDDASMGFATSCYMVKIICKWSTDIFSSIAKFDFGFASARSNHVTSNVSLLALILDKISWILVCVFSITTISSLYERFVRCNVNQFIVCQIVSTLTNENFMINFSDTTI